jgi:hypothetical protein
MYEGTVISRNREMKPWRSNGMKEYTKEWMKEGKDSRRNIEMGE